MLRQLGPREDDEFCLLRKSVMTNSIHNSTASMTDAASLDSKHLPGEAAHAAQWFRTDAAESLMSAAFSFEFSSPIHLPERTDYYSNECTNNPNRWPEPDTYSDEH